MDKKFKAYYRKITEGLPQDLKKLLKKKWKHKNVSDDLLRYFGIFATLFSLILLFCLIFYFLKFLDIINQRAKTLDNLSYWEDVIKTHPNFPQAYFNAGLYSAQLGQRVEAFQYLNKALQIDPSYQQAKLLEESIRE